MIPIVAWKQELDVAADIINKVAADIKKETGKAPNGDFIPLDPLRQPGGKIVFAWAVKGEFDPAALKSNTFSMEWPPNSGRQQEFPEVDRAAWLSMETAMHKILKGQAPFLLQLQKKLGEVALTLGVGPPRVS